MCNQIISETLEANGITTNTITSNNSTLGNINATSLVSDAATVETFSSTLANIKEARLEKLSVAEVLSSLSVISATLTNLLSDKIVTNTLNATLANLSSIISSNATITNLNVTNLTATTFNEGNIPGIFPFVNEYTYEPAAQETINGIVTPINRLYNQEAEVPFKPTKISGYVFIEYSCLDSGVDRQALRLKVSIDQLYRYVNISTVGNLSGGSGLKRELVYAVHDIKEMELPSYITLDKTTGLNDDGSTVLWGDGGVPAVTAKLDGYLTALDFESKLVGAAGNSISVRTVNPGALNRTLTITVTDELTTGGTSYKLITISHATDGVGAIVPTSYNDLITAITNSVPAFALVDCTLASGATGTDTTSDVSGNFSLEDGADEIIIRHPLLSVGFSSDTTNVLQVRPGLSNPTTKAFSTWGNITIDRVDIKSFLDVRK
jgi:hypothetical protein